MFATIIQIISAWSALGSLFCIAWSTLKQTDGWELCNPYWVHVYHFSVNWFGAILLALIFNALCPLGAAGYWVYKLCTIGRR